MKTDYASKLEKLEAKLASFKGTQEACVFATGYSANVGVISAVCGKNDVVILDRLAHASMVDGAKLSGAQIKVFRHNDVKHLVYASSSSVYGANTELPFATSDNVDHPISLYAATKKANELMAHTYSHLFAMPTTGLRFFTVYGPWGRPDMALFLFTKAILEGRPIEVFNHGKMQRDFTYVDDIVEGVVRVSDRIPTPENVPVVPGVSSRAPYRVYNIGNNNPVALMDMIGALEQELGKVAEKKLLPIQPGDVPATYADVADLEADVGFKPATPIAVGIRRFVAWYREFYNV